MDLDEEVQDLTFIQKLQTVVELGELDYWADRNNPPNLPDEDFMNAVERFDKIETHRRNDSEFQRGLRWQQKYKK